MRKEGKIAVIGDSDSTTVYKTIGLDVFNIVNPFEVREKIKELAKSGYIIIYITENIAKQVSDIIAKFKIKAYPAIIPIPCCNESNGFGMLSLKQDVERAIGADILFNK